MDKKILAKVVFLIIGFCGAFYVALANPFPDLSAQGSIALGIFVAAVVMWITDFIPDFVTAIGMMTAWALFKSTTFSTAFAAFSSTTVWMLVGAFGLAGAIAKTGLLKRLALLLMTKFPMTYRGQTSGMLLTSFLIGPLVPSAISKGAILGPLAAMISDNMGYERQGKGANGLFASMLIPTALLYAAFLTATFMNYMILGMMPQEYQAEMTWMKWFIASSVWCVVVLVLTFAFVQIFYKPADASKVGDKKELIKQKEALGKMTRNEIIVSIVLMLCLVFWIFEKSFGINSTVVTLSGVFVLFCLKILNKKDFQTVIPWDLVVFIASVLCCGPVFKATGIDTFFSQQLGPLVTPVMQTSFILFLICYAVVIYLAKFVIVSQTAVLTIFFVALSPVAVSFGVNPWIIGFVTFTANSIWLTKYQNPTYIPLLAMVASGDKPLVTHSQTVPLTVCFMVVNVLGYIASVPLWKMLGFL